MIGQTLSHYKILEKLGEGGMGVVYKAHDTKLDRDVAIKLLPRHVTSGVDDRERFVIEARAAAALNHPNIATIYSIEEIEGETFIAMEYIVGQELKHRIKSGPVTVAQAVEIARQIAEGLEAAHKKGIVHRDIKSSNIMITDAGLVKIMDFGLAKLSGGQQLTQAGSIVGTAAYMSPEQVQGEQLDTRSDLFSFGIVVYELITGNLPFRGEHAVAFGYSIVNEQLIPLETYRTDIHASLRQVILRCLEKNRERRYQNAGEIVADLVKIQRELSGLVHAPKRSMKQLLAFAGISLLVLLGIYWLISLQRVTNSEQRPMISLAQITSSEGVEEFPSWSPDGRVLAFSGEVNGFRKLILKELATGEERQLTVGATDDIQPVWSIDGKTMLFVRSHQSTGKLEPGDIFGQYDGGDIWTIDILTGKEMRIIDNAFNPAISLDGQRIAFDASWSGSRRIWIADMRGRNPQQVTADSSEAVVHINPRWSPDGSKIVFQNMETTTIDLKVVNLSSGKLAAVTHDLFRDINPVWSPSGRYVYFSSDRGGGLNIWRVPISSEGLHSGSPQQLTTGAGQDVEISVSPDGHRLAYTILRLNADIWKLPVDPATGRTSGEAQQAIATTREDSRGAWSPDGNMIAFNSDRSGAMNIWIATIQDGSVRQLTKGVGGDFQPNWSPDASHIVFFSSRAGNADIWIVDVSSGELRQLTKNPSLDINPFYSSSGDHIAYQSDLTGRLEPWVTKADGSDQHSIANLEVSGHFMRWAHDGTSLVFKSPNASRPGLWSASVQGSEPVFVLAVKGGSHISYSPRFDLIMDVVGHKELWISPSSGAPAEKVFESQDAEVRMDYPVWSPDGTWLLFDRVKPQGGDIWSMENIE